MVIMHIYNTKLFSYMTTSHRCLVAVITISPFELSHCKLNLGMSCFNLAYRLDLHECFYHQKAQLNTEKEGDKKYWDVITEIETSKVSS